MITGKLFGREPVLWLTAIQALVALAVGFGLDLSNEQQGLVFAAGAALLSLIVRSQVVPVETYKQHVDHVVTIAGGLPDPDTERTTGAPDTGAVAWGTLALCVIAAVAVLYAFGKLPL